MVAVIGVSILLVLGASIASIWGAGHAASRSDWNWAVVFAACMALLAITGIGLAVIHAPYLLRTLDQLVFLVTTLVALALTGWYLLSERVWAAHN
jgi:hypothetical protein